MKLIKLSNIANTHYIIIDDSEIKDCYYYNLLDKAVRFGNNFNHPYHYKITHSTQPLENVKLISLLEVEEAIDRYNLEKIAQSAFTHPDFGKYKVGSIAYYNGYKDGFKAHQELVKDKLFTTEDVKKAIDLTYKFCDKNSDYIERDKKIYVQEPTIDQETEIIQSLIPKTEWNIEIIDNKIKLL